MSELQVESKKVKVNMHTYALKYANTHRTNTHTPTSGCVHTNTMVQHLINVSKRLHKEVRDLAQANSTRTRENPHSKTHFSINYCDKKYACTHLYTYIVYIVFASPILNSHFATGEEILQILSSKVFWIKVYQEIMT